jgi:hypothetical protein
MKAWLVVILMLLIGAFTFGLGLSGFQKLGLLGLLCLMGLTLLPLYSGSISGIIWGGPGDEETEAALPYLQKPPSPLRRRRA